MIITSSKNFNKQMAKMPQNIELRFFEKLNIFKIDFYHPLLKNHKLRGEWTNHNSINVTSDIRAIYKQSNDKIIFVAIGSHSELYN